MKIVKLDILEDAVLQGVDQIAFVENPAIEEDYYAFSKQTFASYTDYPQAASDNAARAVKWATENGWGGCGTPVGKARAHQLANREPISEETISRMAAFERHRRNSNTPYGRGCGGLMWDAWGGSEGVEWAQRKLQRIREERMGLEVAGLPAYANELLGTNIPKTESFAGERVSFDYHETLNTPAGKELARKAIEEGADVYVISAGQNKDEFLPIVDELGIDHSKVFATGSNSAKIAKIKELSIQKHYDNNQDVIDELQGIGVKFQSAEDLAKNIDVFGYETQYFYICPGAIGTFEHLKSMNPDEETIGMIRTAAVVADQVFKIEHDVVAQKEATHEQLVQALALVQDFKDIMHEIDELVGMTHDVSYMDGHIEVIKSYMPEYIEEAFRAILLEDLKELGYEGFSEDETKTFFAAIEDQQMIVSPLMIPNKLIPRIDEETGEEYYVYFTADTIKKIAHKFMSEKLLDKFNIEHDAGMPVSVAHMVESWIVEDPTSDKSRIYGFSVPPGSWIAMVKVKDRNFWQAYVKSGKTKGFSVEGYFSDMIMSYAKETFVEPRAGESKDEYIGRCIGYHKNEGYADDQAAAICYTKWADR